MKKLTRLLLTFALFGLVACGTDDTKDDTTPELTCAADTDCDDENPCTDDTCSAETSKCVFTQKVCDDADPCTDDTCDAATGECASVAKGCDDANVCTTDSCDAATGLCLNEEKDCDDGDPGTADTCDEVTGECGHAPVECDDLNNCTVDTLDEATGECDHAPVDCDDDDPCTNDSCDNATGDCVNEVVDCDDDDPCTVDSCDPATGDCVNEAKDCEDDDLCTVDSCDPASGYCLNEAADCDDDNSCTADACDAETGDCLNTDLEDGTACDDGDEATEGDVCTAGVCAGTIPSSDPAMFRVSEVTLNTPVLMVDGGEVNTVLSALVTAELNREDWAMLVEFAAFGAGETAVEFGEGSCLLTNDLAPDCAFAADGQQTSFPTTNIVEDGTCYNDGLAAPCFETTMETFDLAAVLPDLFTGDLPGIEGFVVGTLSGPTPDSDAIEGAVIGFLPQDVIDGLDYSIELGDQTYTIADLLANAPVQDNGGVAGWWLDLSFTAERAQIVEVVPVVEPAMFRVDELTLNQPLLSVDGGEINTALSAFVTADINVGDWAMVFEFADFAAGETAVAFGEGDCVLADGQAPDCIFEVGGPQTSFPTTTIVEDGTCDGGGLNAPCFETGTETFDLTAIMGDLFQGDLPGIEGYVVGTLDGATPDSAAITGAVIGFLPQDVVNGMDYTVDLGGETYTFADLVADTPVEDNGGVAGWWLDISFTAERAEIVE